MGQATSPETSSSNLQLDSISIIPRNNNDLGPNRFNCFASCMPTAHSTQGSGTPGEKLPSFSCLEKSRQEAAKQEPKNQDVRINQGELRDSSTPSSSVLYHSDVSSSKKPRKKYRFANMSAPINSDDQNNDSSELSRTLSGQRSTAKASAIDQIMQLQKQNDITGTPQQQRNSKRKNNIFERKSKQIDETSNAHNHSGNKSDVKRVGSDTWKSLEIQIDEEYQTYEENQKMQEFDEQIRIFETQQMIEKNERVLQMKKLMLETIEERETCQTPDKSFPKTKGPVMGASFIRLPANACLELGKSIDIENTSDSDDQANFNGQRSISQSNILSIGLSHIQIDEKQSKKKSNAASSSSTSLKRNLSYSIGNYKTESS